MTALLRYIAVDVLRAQRWLAPLLCYLVILAIIAGSTGSGLSTYAASAALLLVIATWLAVTVNNSEDPIQTQITIVTAGSEARVRMAKWLAAYLGCLTLAGVALIQPVVTGSRVSLSNVAAGSVALALTAIAGVSFGMLCSRPVIRRNAWTVLVGASLCIADTVVPHAPPTRQLLALLNADHPQHIATSMSLIAVETAILCSAVVAFALRVSRQRD